MIIERSALIILDIRERIDNDDKGSFMGAGKPANSRTETAPPSGIHWRISMFPPWSESYIRIFAGIVAIP